LAGCLNLKSIFLKIFRNHLTSLVKRGIVTYMSDTTDYTIDTYYLRFDTPKGQFDVELIGSNLDIATKRAYMTLVHAGYGDIDEIVLVEWGKVDGVVER